MTRVLETCMIPLMKAVLKGFIAFSCTLELQVIYGDVMIQKQNKSCQKPTIELAGRLREKINISP